MIPEKRFVIDLQERNIRPFLLSIRDGECYKISVQFLQGGRPFFGMVEPKLFWQKSDAETGTGWWSKDAFVDESTGAIYAIFDSAQDADSTINDYVFFLSFKFESGDSSQGISYCANGRLRILPSPTATPNHLPVPDKIIDFNDFDQILNAPWLKIEDANFVSKTGLTPVDLNFEIIDSDGNFFRTSPNWQTVDLTLLHSASYDSAGKIVNSMDIAQDMITIKGSDLFGKILWVKFDSQKMNFTYGDGENYYQKTMFYNDIVDKIYLSHYLNDQNIFDTFYFHHLPQGGGVPTIKMIDHCKNSFSDTLYSDVYFQVGAHSHDNSPRVFTLMIFSYTRLDGNRIIFKWVDAEGNRINFVKEDENDPFDLSEIGRKDILLSFEEISENLFLVKKRIVKELY